MQTLLRAPSLGGQHAVPHRSQRLGCDARDAGYTFFAYGPAEGLPDIKVGTLSQDLYDEAKKDGWIVISIKNDWKKIFAFETTNEGGSDEL